MRILNISSTAITSAIYDVSSMTLDVTFTTGVNAYSSWNVPVHVIDAFENADSQGSFYAKYIKRQYSK